MNLRGLPKSPHLKKAVIVNSTHDDGLHKELRFLEEQRKGTITNLMANKRKLIERSKNLPKIRAIHPVLWKDTAEGSMAAASRLQSTEDEEDGQDPMYLTAERRSSKKTLDDWCSLSRERMPFIKTAKSPRSSSPCLAGDESSDALQLLNKTPMGAKAVTNTELSSSMPAQLGTINMNELICKFVAVKRARSSLEVPSLGREQIFRSPPSSPRHRRRGNSVSERPVRESITHTAGLMAEKQTDIEGEITLPKEVSPRLARSRAYTVDSATDYGRKDVTGEGVRLPRIEVTAGFVGRARCQTLSGGSESRGTNSRTNCVDLSAKSSKQDLRERLGGQVWTEESTTTESSEGLTKTTEEISDEKTEAELTPEEMIEEVRYTRYLRLGNRETGDDGLPTHFWSRCVIIGHTKSPLFEASRDSSEDETSEQGTQAGQDKQEQNS